MSDKKDDLIWERIKKGRENVSVKDFTRLFFKYGEDATSRKYLLGHSLAAPTVLNVGQGGTVQKEKLIRTLNNGPAMDKDTLEHIINTSPYFAAVLSILLKRFKKFEIEAFNYLIDLEGLFENYMWFTYLIDRCIESGSSAERALFWRKMNKFTGMNIDRIRLHTFLRDFPVLKSLPVKIRLEAYVLYRDNEEAAKNIIKTFGTEDKLKEALIRYADKGYGISLSKKVPMQWIVESLRELVKENDSSEGVGEKGL